MQHLRDPCAPPERYAVQVNKVEDDDDDDEYEDEVEEEEETAQVNTAICLSRRTSLALDFRRSLGSIFPRLSSKVKRPMKSAC